VLHAEVLKQNIFRSLFSATTVFKMLVPQPSQNHSRYTQVFDSTSQEQLYWEWWLHSQFKLISRCRSLTYTATGLLSRFFAGQLTSYQYSRSMATRRSDPLASLINNAFRYSASECLIPYWHSKEKSAAFLWLKIGTRYMANVVGKHLLPRGDRSHYKHLSVLPNCTQLRRRYHSENWT
jgi:hypothetical protein